MVSKQSDGVGAQQPQQVASSFSSYLSPIDKYRLEWNDLSTVCEDPRLIRLRQIACAGHLKVAKFRSICWSVLLDVLRGDQHDWLQQRRVHRAMYAHIKSRWHTNPHTATPPGVAEDAAACSSSAKPSTTMPTDVAADDPLSQSQQSAWNQHFCDQELYAVIRQDVVRTFPGVDFYRRDAIQELMVNVLFCYAREHPAMCYRQGMHEILAPVLFVMHCDQQTLLHIGDLAREQRAQTAGDAERDDGVGDLLTEIMDPQFMEEDAYFIFMKIMASIESFYHIRDMKPTASGHFPAAGSAVVDLRSKLEVVGQLNHIRDKILAHVDPQLHKHLLALDIPLTLFGIRWLRLLFGREFSLPDLLVLWDAIFADGNFFALTNYVVVAMLVQIRQKLLLGDYTTCLTHLMKYPGNVDVTLVIRYAMHIHSPQLHDCPAGVFLPQTGRRVQQPSTKLSQTAPLQRQPSASTSGGPANTNHKRALSHDERHSRPTSNGSGSSSTSGGSGGAASSTGDEHLKAHLRTIQNTTALAAMRMTAHTQAMQSGEQDTSIVEGFRENSPEALRIELESARAVMSITRFKLTQYLEVLRKHVPPAKAADSIHQAMDGIEELCALLEIKPSADYGRTLPVERAFEAANEPTEVMAAARPKHTDAEAAKRAFVQKFALPIDAHFEIVVHPDSGGIVDTLATGFDGEEIIYDASEASGERHLQPPKHGLQMRRGSAGATNPRYEIPDDRRRISRKASRILGDRKEVEMHEIRPGAEASATVAAAAAATVALPDVDPPGERDSPVY